MNGQMSLFDIYQSDYIHVQKEYKLENNQDESLIAESFGIQGGYINKIVDILIPSEFDIIYITGESGSGKTTIMRELMKTQNYSDYVISNTEKNVPLFSVGGIDKQTETLNYLTSVGLSDATLWLNDYSKLSDSQRARFEIAVKMMKQEVICIDEFLSTLDRKTAKPVAYSIQRAIRRNKKKLIVTTAHDDLLEFLKPDVVIKGCAFPSRWEVKKKNVSSDNPIIKDVELKYGTKEEYRDATLGELHYKGKYTGGTKEFLFAYYDSEMVGLLVSTYNMHTGGRRISRVVVHPSYRGCGIAQKIVKTFLKDYPNTDVVATMALFNPVFERAGMKRVEDTKIVPPKELETQLLSHDFDISKWGKKEYLREYCEDRKVRELLSNYSQKATHIVVPAGAYLSDEEIKTKILYEPQTASRVLFGLRPRTMAKYVNKE